MNLFGWKSAGRAPVRPALSRGLFTWAGGGWPRSYEAQLRELYLENAIAQRAVRLVAEAVAAAPLRATDEAALALIAATSGGQALIETAAVQLLLHGNAYVQILGGPDGPPLELFALRPERVSVEPDARGWPAGFLYRAGGGATRIAAERMIHIRFHHPADDHYGLGCLSAAAGAIAAHNAATRWNKALLDNAARPSGALVTEGGDTLSADQFDRLRGELSESFAGTGNAGRPMLLEGGVRWQPLSLSPSDMDFAALKAASAREIALAFGVPPMLLGLPGDATYANYREANKALWRQSVLPLAGKLLDALAEGLRPWFPGLTLGVDLDQVPALSEERERLWAQLSAADFLSIDEKRAFLGLGPGGDGARTEQTEPQALERKHNPWHDPDDGRFTFRNQGVHAGGGSFGGAGATGTWDAPRRDTGSARRKPRPASTPGTSPAPLRRAVRTPPATPSVSRKTRIEVRNQYSFHIDDKQRTVRVEGEIRRKPDQPRSRTAQRLAGGPDRRSTDQGGHFIAREFGGPTDDFNHFAQDGKFNKSEYRKMEIEIGKEIDSGKKVEVDIRAFYPENSQRPDVIVALITADGKSRVRTFKNESGVAGDGK
jgi:HK97 family phage portal protein